jgi:hypothetical protein
MQQDNLKTQTPTEVLDRAMLGILKVGAPFLGDAPSSSTTSEQTSKGSTPLDEMRSAIALETVAKHPGLTVEKVLMQMASMGF